MLNSHLILFRVPRDAVDLASQNTQLKALPCRAPETP